MGRFYFKLKNHKKFYKPDSVICQWQIACYLSPLGIATKL